MRVVLSLNRNFRFILLRVANHISTLSLRSTHNYLVVTKTQYVCFSCKLCV